jgi:ribosome-associated protein
MIRINRHLTLDENEVSFTFIRAGGPGGQNVNKVASAAQLRFDARHSPALSPDIRERVLRLAGRAATANGEIVITARRHRSQDANRQEALSRLIDLLARSCVRPKPRRATKPSASAKRKRLESKQRRSGLKRRRAAVGAEE